MTHKQISITICLIILLSLAIAIFGTVAIRRMPVSYYGMMIDLHLRGLK